MKPEMQAPLPVTTQPLDAEALFRAHAPFVAAFLRRMGVPAAELDDLVQEVFMVAHRKGGYVPGPAAPRSWLAAIAVRIARAGQRTRQRHAAPKDLAIDELLDDAPSHEQDPASQLETQRALVRVQAALSQLTDDQCATFVLYEIEGESCDSIAHVWQVPVGTVYSRLHVARRRFLDAYAAMTQPRALRARLGLRLREVGK